MPSPRKERDFERIGSTHELHGVVPCSERARIVANRVQYSRAYAITYVAALSLSVLLLVWVVLEADYPLEHRVKFWVFVLADSAVTLFVVLEVVIRALASGGCRFFCMNPWNLLDVAVAVLCITTIFLHVLGPTAVLEDEVEVGVLCLRYAAQITRLLVLVRHLGRMQRAQARELDVHMDADGTSSVGGDGVEAEGPPSPSRRDDAHADLGT